MKLNFLPRLQMDYSDAYGDCDDTIDAHVCANCDDFEIEHGRIRRGAWVHEDAYDPIMEDPTDATKWQDQIDLALVVILPELRGTYDGGTPKLGTGFGDRKEKYLGSDFKANIIDPIYKDNWPHYRSLVGKTNWHFAYLTETQVRITGVPVTIAPKDPIAENLDDEVTWQSDISWFEYFPPQPFDAPMEIFTCAD